MIQVIQEKLTEIERAEKVRILYCAESGSRAWGFPSPDSDYDVRFIYVRPRDYYLRLDKTRDVIEWQLDDTLDISGWDIQKALRLLHGSNPTLFEWNLSPIVYRTTEEWSALSDTLKHYFSKKSCLYHYLNIAKRNRKDRLNGDTVRLKAYFYVLRPLLACKWILEEETPPPMLFSTLMDRFLAEELRPEVENLLKLKMELPEIGTGRRIDRIHEYIDSAIGDIERKINDLPSEEHRRWDELNRVFLSLLDRP